MATTNAAASAVKTGTEETMNIYQKLVKIRESLDVFVKDADTSSEYNKRGYKYVSGSQILEKMKTKMNEYGVILRPNLSPDFALTQFEVTDKYGKTRDNYQYTNVMTYTFINADDPEDREEILWFLTGVQDDPSKAFGSALTYSERYFLLKYFGIPTDEESPETKDNTDEPKRTGNTKQATDIKAEAERRKKEKEQKKEDGKPPEQDLSNEIKALWALTGKDANIWEKALKTCGLTNKNDIKEEHLEQMEKTINELYAEKQAEQEPLPDASV